MVDISKVSPKRDMVVVKMIGLDQIFKDVITPDHSDAESVAVRYGTVVSVGELVDTIEHCPGLKVGDNAIFTEFAGYYIPTENDMYKVIRGYDIIGKFMNGVDIEKDSNVVPTGPRILVELFDVTKTEDGILTGDNNDPRLADLQYGRVLKVNDAINELNLKVGDRIAFPPYAGTTIRNYESDDKKEIKILVEYDAVFTF